MGQIITVLLVSQVKLIIKSAGLIQKINTGVIEDMYALAFLCAVHCVSLLKKRLLSCIIQIVNILWL